jgi:N-acyl-D-aspartate/D-glutamate deacylase
VHTHYDAQVFWDPTLTPSSIHGVTTVVAGHCGFSVAPMSAAAAPYLREMLAKVEGMPLESLAALKWDWTSYADYVGRVAGNIGVNIGFMAGHSAIRRVVMGGRSNITVPTGEEMAAMQSLLRECLRAGAMGFSTSMSSTHNDGAGEPIPSRFARHDEFVALAAVCGEFEGTSLELSPDPGIWAAEKLETVTAMSLAAGRAVNFSAIGVNDDTPEILEFLLGVGDQARARGGEIVGLIGVSPVTLRMNLLTGVTFDYLPAWVDLFKLAPAERIERLKNDALRGELDRRANSEEAGFFRFLGDWGALTVEGAFTPETKRYEGRTIADIAAEEGRRPIDVLLDTSISDGLRTVYSLTLKGGSDSEWRERARCWLDSRTIVGASDAGAHLDLLDSFAFSTTLLAEGVRRRGLLSLEQAVHLLSARGAQLYGLHDRGLLQSGYRADIVVFDPETVGCGPVYTRFDMPAGAGRLFADPLGIRHVLVNGVETVRDNHHTGALPGHVLRAGSDTRTPQLPLAMRIDNRAA